MYTDTCPHNESFWKSIYGASLETKLGLFHLLHRIYDTLDPRCNLYWKCLVQLKNAVYTYFEEDEAGLLAALKDGSFSKTNKKLSDAETRRDLRHSKRWKQRCGEFLQKKTHLTRQSNIDSLFGSRSSKMPQMRVANLFSLETPKKLRPSS